MIEPYNIQQTANELTPLRVRIYTTDNQENNIQKLIEFENPIIKKEPIPVYEAQWEFEAELPYEMEGWTQAQDLTKLDKEELEKKVIAKYKDYWQYINYGENDKILQAQYKAEKEKCMSLYYNDTLTDEFLNTDYYSLQKEKMYPLQNYSLKFYGNGRLVALESTDTLLTELEDRSFYTFNKSALRSFSESPNDDGVCVYYNYFLLMIPNGGTELEIARAIQGID